jgi:hypothetical protein
MRPTLGGGLYVPDMVGVIDDAPRHAAN